MKTFEINGKEYSGKPFDFNLVCDLEDMGVSVESMEEKPMSMVRGYIALCMGKRRADAGLEIQEHIPNGQMGRLRTVAYRGFEKFGGG